MCPSVRVCVCACVSVPCVHVGACVSVLCVHVCAYVHTCLSRVCMCVYVHVCLSLCVWCVCMCMCVCPSVCTCVCMPECVAVWSVSHHTCSPVHINQKTSNLMTSAHRHHCPPRRAPGPDTPTQDSAGDTCSSCVSNSTLFSLQSVLISLINYIITPPKT